MFIAAATKWGESLPQRSQRTQGFVDFVFFAAHNFICYEFRGRDLVLLEELPLAALRA